MNPSNEELNCVNHDQEDKSEWTFDIFAAKRSSMLDRLPLHPPIRSNNQATSVPLITYLDTHFACRVDKGVMSGISSNSHKSSSQRRSARKPPIFRPRSQSVGALARVAS